MFLIHLLNLIYKYSISRCYFIWWQKHSFCHHVTSVIFVLHQLIILIYKYSGPLLSSMLHHDPCEQILPTGGSVEFARQTFKHDFDPPAAGNLRLVLNVTSTYDWSDLNFIFSCTVALNQNQAVGCDYNVRRVVIFRYGTNCFVPVASLSIT